jgi:Fic family protein
MRRFLKWWEDSRPGHAGKARMDGIVRAGVAHLWFETVHPFEDGNGRVGRAIVDMALAQDVDSARRFYSISHQLMDQRKAYYANLNAAQSGPLDVTPWAVFFVDQFRLACVTSQHVIAGAIEKSRFWATHALQDMNERQRKVVKRLLDAGNGGFQGGMTAEKYVSLTGASKATATRDLAHMQKAGLLVVTGQGRGTRYWINVPGWSVEAK